MYLQDRNKLRAIENRLVLAEEERRAGEARAGVWG